MKPGKEQIKVKKAPVRLKSIIIQWLNQLGKWSAQLTKTKDNSIFLARKKRKIATTFVADVDHLKLSKMNSTHKY